MRISRDRIPEAGLEVRFEEAAAQHPVLLELERSGECRFLAALAGYLTLQPVGAKVRLRGLLQTRVELTCSRCLERFVLQLQADLDLLYAAAPAARGAPPAGPTVELRAEEAALIYFDGERIDTAEAVGEEVLAALPLKPLCSAACRGLCTKCGGNRNTGECRCPADAVDPRLAVLAGLKLR